MEKDEARIDSLEIKTTTTVTGGETQPQHVLTSTTWPTEPTALALSLNERVAWAVYDLALILVPVGLIVKTGLVILASRLDELHRGPDFDQATSLSRYLVNLNDQLVTLFTIVFVTILSTFVKRYALWKAQKGACLSELEQLQGSVSLPSTLKLIWSLRLFSTTSVFLVLVWTFYYLGSQAAKDEYIASNSEAMKKQYAVMQRGDAPNVFTTEIGNLFDFLDRPGNRFYNSDIITLNSAFTSVLFLFKNSPDNHNNPGTNGGPLIPDFDSVLASHTTQNLADRLKYSFGWVDVSQQSKNDGSYTSLQGVSPILSQHLEKIDLWVPLIDTQILGSYTLNTSYLSVGCSDLQILPLNAYPNGTSSNSSFSLNLTSYRPDAPRDIAGRSLREFEFWYRTTLWPAGAPNDVEYHALKAVCNITTKLIDLKVSCLTTGCYPHSMRWQNNTNATEATSYSTPFDSEDLGRNFLSNLTLSTGIVSDWVADANTLLLDYFLTPNISVSYDASDSSTWYGHVNAMYLTQLLNTYLTISQSQMSGQVLSKSARIEPLLVGTYSPLLTRQEVKGASLLRAYRINWAWIAIDFVSSLILLAAAIASWRLRLKTLAPDIFGYVSSLTRCNEHLPLPSEGSMLSGMDRARMLKHVKVKIGEIQSTSSFGGRSVGTIGLAPVDNRILGLQRERLYY